METIESVVFKRYLSQQSKPKKEYIDASNYIDWAHIALNEAQRFIPIEEELPPEGVECLLQNEKWINEDYNPKGIRNGFLGGDGIWVSNYWCNYHDEYHTRTSDEDDESFSDPKAENQVPTHWRPYFRK